jgi:LuxR family maltose regulon positive regulatory protein
LFARLDESTAASRLVVLTAAAGSGKTALLSSWTASLGGDTHVRRIAPTQPFDLALLADEILLQMPPADALETWSQETRRRWIVVLDGGPCWPVEAMNDALDRFLRVTGSEVGVVLAGTEWPTLDLGRLGVAGQSLPITTADLTMDLDEIAEVLIRHQVDPTDAIVRAVAGRTEGWACGVRIAAQLLNGSASVTATLEETDRAIEDYLITSIIPGLSASGLELLTRTSLVDAVDPELADAVAGADAALGIEDIRGCRGFVQVRADGSFRSHPLLRRLLLRRLRRDPSLVLAASRQVAGWTSAHGGTAAAIQIAARAGDWEWAARTMVESLAVPRLLTSGAEDLREHPEAADALGAAEPLLLAAAALQRCLPDVAAEVLLDAARAEPTEDPTVAYQLSDALVRLVSARWHADRLGGLEQDRRLTRLVPQLSLAQRAATPELIPLIQSSAGVFELWSGAPERARTAFERGARAFGQREEPGTDSATKIASTACLGQLAWLEALGGELNRSVQHAGDVLTARPADGRETGVVHAQLATVCAHAARGELEQATQRFDSVVARSGSIEGEIEPAVATAIQLTAARLATVVGDVGGVSGSILSDATSGWFGEQLWLARIEAELNASQPTQALRLLRESGLSGAEAQVLRARALIVLGDPTAAGAVLRTRPIERLGVLTQIQLELVQAWLAHGRGDRRHQRSLIDRALRTAGREELRTPIAWAKSWLQAAIASDRELLRRHGSFLASIRATRPYARREDLPSGIIPTPPTGALTKRELDILQRLGSLSTNEEIAAELFLSTNTVKTHLKSLFRKLEVARRSEAFRRGRALGLC